MDNLDTQTADNDQTQEETTQGGEQQVATETNEEKQHWLGDLADNPSLEKFKEKEPQDLAKSYAELQKLVGHEKIVLPKEEDSELWNDVWSRLGRPETTDGYKLDGEKLEKSMVNEEGLEKIKEVAHKAGITNKQLEAMVDSYLDVTGEMHESFRNETSRKVEEDIKGLQKEWGGAFEERTQIAQKAYKSLCADNEALKQKMDNGLGNDPDIIKMFYSIGTQMTEDAIQGKSRPLSMTPDAAKAEIEKIKLDPKSAFNDETNPEHEAAKEKVMALYRYAYPELG